MNKVKNDIDNVLGIINGKLNISFTPNKFVDVNNEIEPKNQQNDNNNKHEMDKLKLLDEENKIKLFSKNKINDDFIQRIKDNNKFIKNNIILKDNLDVSIKKNHSLKLYKLKGDYLNKK